MRSLLALSVSLICATAALAQSAGDVLMSAKGEGGGLVPVWVTKSANKIIGWDGSGNLVPVTQATPTWGHINGSLTDQEDLREALADKLSINAATGLYQPLNAQLSAIGALTTTAFGRGLLTAADAAAARTAQGLGTLATQNGTLTDYLLITTAAATYQPLNEQLTLFSEIPHTPFGRALLNVADAEALRTAAEVPEIATQEAAETGESNSSLMTPLRTAQAIAALGGGGSSVNVQEFTTNGTWTNPSPDTPRNVRFLLIGGGGGGGSGRRGTTGSSGGGGGGGPGLIVFISTAVTTDFEASEGVTVGTGGSGGPAQLMDSTAGVHGTAGGNTAFGGWTAPGGNAGNGGVAATAPGGSTVAGGNVSDWGVASALAGGNGSNVAAPVLSVSDMASGSPGAGGGGGGGDSSTPRAGRTGTNLFLPANNPVSGGAGGVAHGESGGDGTMGRRQCGSGAGGGAGGTASIPGGNGGNGVRGSGGGGGGGSVNGANSGAGGNGGDGYVLIITY